MRYFSPQNDVNPTRSRGFWHKTSVPSDFARSCCNFFSVGFWDFFLSKDFSRIVFRTFSFHLLGPCARVCVCVFVWVCFRFFEILMFLPPNQDDALPTWTSFLGLINFPCFSLSLQAWLDDRGPIGGTIGVKAMCQCYIYEWRDKKKPRHTGTLAPLSQENIFFCARYRQNEPKIANTFRDFCFSK